MALLFFGSCHYIVECRWREKIADVRQVDGLLGQVLRSGAQSSGLFFSVNGWSQNVPKLLKQNSSKVIVLMDGEDFRAVLAGEISMERLLEGKNSALNFKGDPFVNFKTILSKNLT
jgi:hypothetical protein